MNSWARLAAPLVREPYKSLPFLLNFAPTRGNTDQNNCSHLTYTFDDPVCPCRTFGTRLGG